MSDTRRSYAIGLRPGERKDLERWARGRTTPQRLVLRSRIVLALAEGLSHASVARRLATTRHTVRLWKRRFIEGGLEALRVDAPGRGRKPRLDAGALDAVLRVSGEPRPSVRQLARQLGASSSAVHRALVDARRSEDVVRSHLPLKRKR
jgi:hypothetical protein